MRATEYLFYVVMIGAFVFLAISMASDIDKSYENNPINTSEYEGEFNQIESIQGRANQSYSNFATLSDTEKSWFQKIGAGIVAIPYAVVNFPIMIITAISAITSFTSKSLGFLPATILLAIFTFIIIEVVRRFMEFFQRSRA